MTEPKEEKCEACCGSGYINFWTDDGHISMRTCRRCDGYGYIKVKPQTNEEWFCNLSTEEKAKVLRRKTHGNDEENERIEQGCVNWLKAKHEDNPPDIPSVPSWDKWLEGERTKCEYCDGNGVECDLYGRSECPKTPKTEQEYLQTCNTEQLAEWLRGVYWHCHEIDCKHCNYPWRCMEKGDIVEWLKQKHTPIS